jgi:hypothetical protein
MIRGSYLLLVALAACLLSSAAEILDRSPRPYCEFKLRPIAPRPTELATGPVLHARETPEEPSNLAEVEHPLPETVLTAAIENTEPAVEVPVSDESLGGEPVPIELLTAIETGTFDDDTLDGPGEPADGDTFTSAGGKVTGEVEPSAAADRETVSGGADAVTPAEIVIHTDYRTAMKEAVEDRKLLFIYFHEPDLTAARCAFERETLADLEIREKLKRYVFVKLPRDAQIVVGGEPTRLLGHPAFAHMLGRQGIAILDLAHTKADYYGHVVSTFPFTPGKFYRKAALSIILDLPSGTLTQRTMIYAVRIHPEHPASTQGQFHTVLADEAKDHAKYQAAILVQGHHSWDSRFQRINSRLPDGVLAQEVVAESWPNETLVEACIECVHSWRQSPGHWGAVRSRQPLFGYDIMRGRNGIWYATGIFGRR